MAIRLSTQPRRTLPLMIATSTTLVFFVAVSFARRFAAVVVLYPTHCDARRLSARQDLPQLLLALLQSFSFHLLFHLQNQYETTS
jgi:hypothetical protein